jgi:hypothetical protein
VEEGDVDGVTGRQVVDRDSCERHCGGESEAVFDGTVKAREEYALDVLDCGGGGGGWRGSCSAELGVQSPIP